MYAIINTGGKQYRVQPGDVLDIERLEIEPGTEFDVGRVLAVSNDDGLQVGTPEVPDIAVRATLVEHRRGDKKIVFKMKRRKGYRRKQGHRQELSRVRILSIGAPGAAESQPAEPESVPQEAAEDAE